MARSKGNQRGKQINNEIWGHTEFTVNDGKVYPAIGGSEVGSPRAKRYAKQLAHRMQRRKPIGEDIE